MTSARAIARLCAAGLSERDAAVVAAVCRAIEDAEDAQDLDAVARSLDITAGSLQRAFRRVTGLTPRAYARALRQKRVAAGLEAGEGVTETIVGAVRSTLHVRD